MKKNGKKKRIVFFQVTFFPGIHGNAIQLLNLCKRLQHKGFETMVLTTRYRREYPVRDVIQGIPVYRLPPYGPKKWQVIRFYLHFLVYLIAKSRSYDILNLTTAGWINFLAPLLMHVLGKKSVYTTILYGYDNPSYFRSTRQGNFKMNLLTRMDHIITVSPALYDDCLAQGIREEKLTYISMGVDTELFHPLKNENEKRDLRRKFGFPVDKKIVIFAGMIIHRKGPDIALDVWKRAAKKRDDLLLIMAGANSKKENISIDEQFVSKLHKYIETFGLQEKVLMKGLVPGSERMSELYRLSDIFFFPSRREGLPNTLLEAMACGLPSVVSLLPGSTDKVITSEENGYLVQGNSEEYVERILLLLDNEKLKTKMGRKARERVLNNYSLNRCVKQYIDLYNKLCFPEISE